ncbi:MAG TPA: nitrilase-related carbon-nitrogen hydrolase [Candidatus Paceibacterota bacterium]|nr:nitrilase-related carbon-nitrogen hydrolase [Candidatus Paceibacterota bacterium]
MGAFVECYSVLVLYDYVRGRWYLLAALSGALLIASFYPVYWWPLCFVALVPLCLTVGIPGIRPRTLFLAGLVAVGMLTFTFSFFLVVQFNWLPASPRFVELIRWAGIAAATLGYGSLFGLWLALYGWLRSRSALINALMGAALYIVAERIAEFSVGGYYLGVFAHAVTALPVLVGLAAVGGASLVSFAVVLCNLVIAEALMAPRESRRSAWRSGGVALAALLAVSLANQAYLRAHDGPDEPFTAAAVQVASHAQKVFASSTPGGALEFPWLGRTLAEAAQDGTDLAVYPESPVSGIATRDTAAVPADAAWVAGSEAALKDWMLVHAPKGAAVMTWENIAQAGTITTQFQFWEKGELSGELLKHSLLPFMDYEPAWARSVGLYSMPFDVAAGPAEAGVARVGGVAIGGLVCSEVHRQGRARAEAAGARILIAAGSEAMFQDDGTSRFSLRAAQYRAAENNVPVVRASLLGPSAIIDRTGRIVSELPLGEGGIARGTVSVAPGARTPYSAWGNLPLAALIMISVSLALRARFPGRKERD